MLKIHPLGLVLVRNWLDFLWKSPQNKRETEAKLSSLLKGAKAERGYNVLNCLWGTVIRWTRYIRDKSRAYLKGHLRDNRCKLHRGRNVQTMFVAYWPKVSWVVRENLLSGVALKVGKRTHKLEPRVREKLNARIPGVSQDGTHSHQSEGFVTMLFRGSLSLMVVELQHLGSTK